MAEEQKDEQKEIKDEIEENSKQDLKDLAEDKDSEIADLTQQLNDAQDKYLRAVAENQNMSNRFKKEQEQQAKYNGQSLAKAVLPVLDNLDRALQTEVTDENGKQLKTGIEMVYNHLESALKENGVTEIKADGQPFDPNVHQAIQTAPAEDGQEPNMVVQVLQKGYMLKDRVLRPSMVVVSQ